MHEWISTEFSSKHSNCTAHSKYSKCSIASKTITFYLVIFTPRRRSSQLPDIFRLFTFLFSPPIRCIKETAGADFCLVSIPRVGKFEASFLISKFLAGWPCLGRVGRGLFRIGHTSHRISCNTTTTWTLSFLLCVFLCSLFPQQIFLFLSFHLSYSLC